MMRASDLVDGLGEANNPEWKTVALNSTGELVAPNGSIGFRWGEKENGTRNRWRRASKLNCRSLYSVSMMTWRVSLSPILAATKPTFSQRAAGTGAGTSVTGETPGSGGR